MDVAEVDGAEGVGAFDALTGAGRFLAKVLAEVAELFDVGGVPCYS